MLHKLIFMVALFVAGGIGGAFLVFNLGEHRTPPKVGAMASVAKVVEKVPVSVIPSYLDLPYGKTVCAPNSFPDVATDGSVWIQGYSHVYEPLIDGKAWYDDWVLITRWPDGLYIHFPNRGSIPAVDSSHTPEYFQSIKYTKAAVITIGGE